LGAIEPQHPPLLGEPSDRVVDTIVDVVVKGSQAVRSVWAALALAMAGCNAFDASRLGPLASSPRPPNDDHHAVPDAGFDATTYEPPNDHDAAAPQPEPDGSLSDSGEGDGLDATVRDDAGRDAGDDAEAGDASDLPDADICNSVSTSDYCAQLPELPAPPVIDGVLDCGPPLRTFVPSSWNGAIPIPTNHATQHAFAYRIDGLYAYLEVRGQTPAAHPSDSPIYCGDAVELYVDADGVIASDGAYDQPGTMQIIIAAPASPAAPSPHAERFRSGASQGAWTSSAYRVAWLDDGYAIEAFITAAELGLTTWSPATAMGIDVVIDVSGPTADPDLRCGRQLGQYFLRVSTATPSDCNGEPWCDARAFCTPSFSPAP